MPGGRGGVSTAQINKLAQQAARDVLRDHGVRTRRPGARTRKPKTFGQWLGMKGSKAMGRGTVARGMRGTWRFGKKEAEGWRERRTAAKEHRDPTIPTRRARAREGLKAKIDGHRSFTVCHSCGSSLDQTEATNHDCVRGGKAERGAKARAQMAELDRRAPVLSQEAQDHLAAHKAMRKRQMTFKQRTVDTVMRNVAHGMGFAADCPSCGRILYGDERHQCRKPDPKPDPKPAATPAASSTPAATPVGSSSAPPPAGPGAVSTAPLLRTPVPAAAPAAGSTPATPKAAPATATTPASPAATTSSTNGKRPAMTAPASTPTTTAGVSAAARAIIQGFTVVGNEPLTTLHALQYNFASLREAFRHGTLSIEQMQNIVGAPLGGTNERLDPPCLESLSLIPIALAESALALDRTIAAVRARYRDIINHYESGVPTPGKKFFDPN